jgi:serine/threonine-protein kinase
MLNDRLGESARFPLTEVGLLVHQIGSALSVAHSAGVIHRDLKPANIFLVRGPDGERAKVFDFGVAKAMADLAIADTTADGVLIGTPRYMSPEQTHGAKAVDHRCDLWALAVIAYRALTGRMPFTGSGVGEIIGNINTQNHARATSLVLGLPAEIDEFFDRALAKDPSNRFQSASDMVNEFVKLADISISSAEFAAVDDPSRVLSMGRRRRPSESGERSLGALSAPSQPSRGRVLARVGGIVAALALAAALVIVMQRPSVNGTAAQATAGPAPASVAPPPAANGAGAATSTPTAAPSDAGPNSPSGAPADRRGPDETPRAATSASAPALTSPKKPPSRGTGTSTKPAPFMDP